MTAPTGGDWPIIDIIMMSDYSGPSAVSSVNPAVSNKPDRFVRIHMDVYFDTTVDVEGLIKSGKLQDAYNSIVAFNDPQGKYANSPGSKMLALAFGQ